VRESLVLHLLVACRVVSVTVRVLPPQTHLTCRARAHRALRTETFARATPWAALVSVSTHDCVGLLSLYSHEFLR